MALSTFRANTFRAQTFTTVFGSQPAAVTPPVVVEQQGAGRVLPFRRIANTPEVSGVAAFHWDVSWPTVVVPPALFRKSALFKVDVDISPVVYPDPLPERVKRRKTAVALPQFEVKPVGGVTTPVTGVELVSLSCECGTTSTDCTVTAGATTTVNTSVNYAMRIVLPPTTVRNPTDEELVVITLGML